MNRMDNRPKVPATPELDKILAIKDQSQIIGEFLDWMFAPAPEGANSYPYMIEYEEWQEKCGNCDGRGYLGEDPVVPTDNELKTVHELLHLVDHETLGDACGRCKGRGYINKHEERECELPINIQYWLERYFKIDSQKAERERVKLLEYSRELNAWSDRESTRVRESAHESSTVVLP